MARRLIGAIAVMLAAVACTKDKVKVTAVPEQSKWEKICGAYEVFDSSGTFLYEMKITHVKGATPEGSERDSLHFENFDGQFNFTNVQSNIISVSRPETYFDIGSHNPIRDTAEKRWFLFGPIADNSNFVYNDSITLSFSRDNILYYMSDLTPYQKCNCKQIAVKKH